MDFTMICILGLDVSSLDKLKHNIQLFLTILFAISRSIDNKHKQNNARSQDYIGQQINMITI